MGSKGSIWKMTVAELIAHLQTFDENAVVIVSISDEYGDLYVLTKIEAGEIESRGKYVILFDNMPYTEKEIDEILA